MDRELNFGELLESEFLDLIGFDYVDMMMEDNGHDYLNPGTQIQGYCEVDSQEQRHNETTTNMADLPSQSFPDREVLLKTVREIAFSQGFVPVIKRSKQNRYVINGCDRGGSYRSNQSSIPKSGKKKSGTRLINCPFQIWGKMKKDTSWRIEIKDLSINHELSSDISGHPYARRFSEEEVKQIREMVAAGIAPRQMLTKIRQGNSNLNAIYRIIYNVKSKIIKDSLVGRSMIQALMEEIGKGGNDSNTMGLPCAHMMKRMGHQELKLECIHPQWRLDNISLLRNQEKSDLNGDQIDALVGELQNKYNQLPLAQNEGVRQQISQFINSSGPFILEAKIRQYKNLASSSSNKKKQMTSTKRDPSAFEVAQKVRKCSKCGETSHDR